MKNKTMLAKTELEKTEKPLADQLIAEGLQDKIDGFSALLDHEGMVGTVGVYGISRWTPYRHRKASLMAMERRPITEIQHCLGHESIAITSKYLQLLGFNGY